MSRKARHRAEYALFRVGRFLLLALPEPAALALGAAAGWLAGTVLRIRRSDVDRHLAWALPERTPRMRAALARASYAHLGREAVATFRLAGVSQEDLRERTSISGLEDFRAALARGKGVVLVTGHLGNWEVGGAALAARGIAVDAVAKGMANRRFDADLVATRERLGMRVIEMGRAHREVLRALRAGRVAALVADQNMHRNGIFVDFFGRAAATARGPAVFALRTGAPLFLGTCLAETGRPHRYRITLRRIEARRSGDFETDVLALTRAHVAALEEAVRAAPGQYFWQHKRWKTRPAQEPASAAPV